MGSAQCEDSVCVPWSDLLTAADIHGDNYWLLVLKRWGALLLFWCSLMFSFSYILHLGTLTAVLVLSLMGTCPPIKVTLTNKRNLLYSSLQAKGKSWEERKANDDLPIAKGREWAPVSDSSDETDWVQRFFRWYDSLENGWNLSTIFSIYGSGKLFHLTLTTLTYNSGRLDDEEVH